RVRVQKQKRRPRSMSRQFDLDSADIAKLDGRGNLVMRHQRDPFRWVAARRARRTKATFNKKSSRYRAQTSNNTPATAGCSAVRVSNGVYRGVKARQPCERRRARLDP